MRVSNRIINLQKEEVENTIKYLSEEVEKIKTAQLSGGIVTGKQIGRAHV